MATPYTKILLSAAVAASAAMFASCDDVKSDDRYIPGEEISVRRTVLLEDFTGQMCVNCPEAHGVIEQLEEQFGKENVVAVSIHCGTFGLSTSLTNFDKNFICLKTAEGDAILEAYGINRFPMGVINYGQPETYDTWPTTVRSQLDLPSDVTMDVAAEYLPSENDGDGYFGNISVKASVLSSSTRQSNVQFWIVEDGIVATQRSVDGTIPNYVHNNVFRAQMLPGLKGDAITLTDGIITEVEASIPTRWTDKERWEINNLSVVAIVSDASGVLQVKRVKLVDDGQDDNSDNN